MNTCCEKCEWSITNDKAAFQNCTNTTCECHQVKPTHYPVCTSFKGLPCNCPEKPTHEIGWHKTLFDLIYSPDSGRAESYVEVKSLITDLLTHQKESVVSKLKGLKKKIANKPHGDSNAVRRKKAYNQALADAVEVVKEA